jgi:hypothetical protein
MKKLLKMKQLLKKTRISIQAHLIEKIKEINKLDAQFYDYAK